ncbi:MAG: HEPN domain-containing protein [Bacteroidaceae bacterium]|nr:HEPN domain-containing protein [Bacteroidaceae bacterium]
MREEDRKSMVAHHREKAHHILNQATKMMEMEQWDMAVNRYYYACFHILQALFVSKGLSAHTHSGSSTVFGQHFVKTGIVDLSYGRFFATMVQLRQKADYNSVANITEQDARDIVDQSLDFVAKVGSLIEG